MMRISPLGRTLTTLVWVTTVATGCTSQPQETTATSTASLAGILGANPDLSAATELLILTQPDDVMKGVSPHTVFVPTNEALTSYAIRVGLGDLDTLLAQVRADPQVTGRFIENLVVDGRVTSGDFVENNNETFECRSGLAITIRVKDGLITLETPNSVSSVVVVDYATGLTYAHVVDSVPW